VTAMPTVAVFIVAAVTLTRVSSLENSKAKESGRDTSGNNKDSSQNEETASY
jgi:hypothetical protein